MKLVELMPSIFEMIGYGYEEIRSDEYEELIEGLLAGFETVERPKLKQISGVPGSGKSMLCKVCKADDFLFLSFDAIMHLLPQYKKDAREVGLIKAFDKWEMPARVIGYEVLRRAVEGRVNILLEHSGVNNSHVELFRNVKKLGYETEVNFTICDIEIAVKRAEAREKDILRHTPRKIIEERAPLMDEYIAVYMKIADKVVVYNTCGEAPELVW